MYAIVETGGKQFRVREGHLVRVERLEGEVGDRITFDQVLLVADSSERHLGAPVVEGAQVSGTIEEQGKDDKVTVFKFKRRKMYRRKRGHRQKFSAVRIDSIDLKGAKKKKTSAKEEKQESAAAPATQEKVKKTESAEKPAAEEKDSPEKKVSAKADRKSEAKSGSDKKVPAKKAGDQKKKSTTSGNKKK